jgi:hypothetical protein
MLTLFQWAADTDSKKMTIYVFVSIAFITCIDLFKKFAIYLFNILT